MATTAELIQLDIDITCAIASKASAEAAAEAAAALHESWCQTLTDLLVDRDACIEILFGGGEAATATKGGSILERLLAMTPEQQYEFAKKTLGHVAAMKVVDVLAIPYPETPEES